MSEQREKVREIFERARRLPALERRVLLDSLSAAEAGVRAEVEDMLRALDEAGGFLSSPTHTPDPSAATLVAPVREGPGTRIGAYKLLQLIGEGGFGSVFMAEQERPVSRKVAIKIIKLGMDTGQVVARFEQERQALALMDHPNIARVLDAGSTETGRPYFVMELVTGDPIVEYCDKNSLSIPDRIELLSQVCNAVQHAHTKGIIHRDIKPSNIIVSTQDGKPHARVIDFGIAKATAARLTERTLFTEHRQLIGTPEYMSPEQAEGSLDIDTRTDVYSLGVLLYELLTGTTPFSSSQLRSAAFGEIQRIIREVEPPRPSTRLSRNADTLASVAARRDIEPRKLGTLVRGELDWIVMKALEKDRKRRYETANGFGLDLRRYLAGEAVVAAPPGAAYRFRKFVHRHRAGVVLAAAVTFASALGLVGTSVGLLRAIAERNRADEAARLAKAASLEAQARTLELERVVSFQSTQLSGVDVMQMGIGFRRDLLDGIRRAGEASHQSGETIAAEIESVDRAIAGVDLTGVARSALEESILSPSIDAIREQFAEQPRIRADLLLTVSESARGLGAFDFAERPGREALDTHAATSGPTDDRTLNARMRRALLLKDRGKLDEAEAELRECVPLAVARHGDQARITVELRSNLATVLTARTQYAEAADLYRTSLAWYRAHVESTDADMLGCMGSLASALANLEKFDEAEPLFREATEGMRASKGAKGVRTLQAMNNFAGFYRSKKEYGKALDIFNEALEESRKSLGQDHWLTLMITDNIGGVRLALGDVQGAAEYARAALDGRRKVLGATHPASLRSCYNLARVLETQQQSEEALTLYRAAVNGFREAYGEFHAHSITARNSLAGALLNASRFEECSQLLLAEVESLPHHPEAPAQRRRAVVRALGLLYEKWDAAEPHVGHDQKAAEWKSLLEQLEPPAPESGSKPPPR